MRVWILQTGEPLHIDGGNPRPMRAMNLANALIAAGHTVVIWSSCFYHQEKVQRLQGAGSIKVSDSLEIRLIASPGYNRNIGIGRLWDHAVLAKNLSVQLRTEEELPDAALVGYPPIEVAAVMTKWLSNRGVPFVIDVKDQWPKIFIEALPARFKLIGRIILSPYFYYGSHSIKDATGITSMAKDFLHWAAAFAGRSVNKMDLLVPLTSPTNQIPVREIEEAGIWWDERGIKDDNVFKLCFIGSHSRAFDVNPIVKAAQYASSMNKDYKFIICGDGEESAAWRAKFQNLANVIFAGWIDRAKIESLAGRSAVALAPYLNCDNFEMNIPNKVIDALSFGLPILCPLRGEVENLIRENDVGMTYGAVSGRSLEACIQELAEDFDLLKRLSESSRRLYLEKFSFDTVYGALVTHLEKIASQR